MSGARDVASRSGAIGDAARGQPLRLRLFVAGNAPNSAQARANLRTLLRRYHLPEEGVDVVDCLRDPLRALEQGVLVTPTLVRVQPEPAVTIIGTLRDSHGVMDMLGLRRGAPRDGSGA